MTIMEETVAAQASALCMACGLCCTGHLFGWTKLRSSELKPLESLGLKVHRTVPSQRGFNQPCPLWQGQCTIYELPVYPRSCQTYRCRLLRQLMDQTTDLPSALQRVESAKRSIAEVEALLPPSPNPNFRERLVEQMEAGGQPGEHGSLLRLARGLLALYAEVFGVTDLVPESLNGDSAPSPAE